MRRASLAAVVLVLLFSTLAFAGQTPPPWADTVFNALGAMPGMINEEGGKVVVIGVAGDVTKLKKHGFKVEPGMPCRVRVYQVKKGVYSVEVGAMGRRGEAQVKELKLP